ncbi:MAG: BspA family leucine-rich repeat surface protein, partial [Clostridia bacterium]|nr:BspA family leucine-rich repeat surface protein [Clostridia bacterium]
DRWDVSNVKNMNNMFGKCTTFNQNLGNWNLSSICNMTAMFEGCTVFEGNGLENWKPYIESNKKLHKISIFKDCPNMNKKLSWNV